MKIVSKMIKNEHEFHLTGHGLNCFKVCNNKTTLLQAILHPPQQGGAETGHLAIDLLGVLYDIASPNAMRLIQCH